jgi:hypothetical protein
MCLAQDNDMVSASSLIFDLKAEAKTATMKHRSPIIPPT